jgi:hypothetical protein
LLLDFLQVAELGLLLSHLGHEGLYLLVLLLLVHELLLLAQLAL